ncbi:MAG: hypothetical protein IPL28_05835 [Chloroflexi bacterium]|nr:hypothetical protein [Chloroflexota bacterium]
MGGEQTNVALLAEQGVATSALLPVHVILRDYAAVACRQVKPVAIHHQRIAGRGVAPLCGSAGNTSKHKGLALAGWLGRSARTERAAGGVAKAIEQFERDFPKVRILVTTRPLCL